MVTHCLLFVLFFCCCGFLRKVLVEVDSDVNGFARVLSCILLWCTVTLVLARILSAWLWTFRLHCLSSWQIAWNSQLACVPPKRKHLPGDPPTARGVPTFYIVTSFTCTTGNIVALRHNFFFLSENCTSAHARNVLCCLTWIALCHSVWSSGLVCIVFNLNSKIEKKRGIFVDEDASTRVNI